MVRSLAVRPNVVRPLGACALLSAGCGALLVLGLGVPDASAAPSTGSSGRSGEAHSAAHSAPGSARKSAGNANNSPRNGNVGLAISFDGLTVVQLGNATASTAPGTGGIAV